MELAQTELRDRATALGYRIRQLTLPVAATPLLAGSAAAQSAADQAGNAMCQSGMGPIVTLILGGIAAGLIIIAALRGMLAFNNLGSARSDKKQEGKEQAKGAGITLLGVFIPGFIAFALSAAGLSPFQCIDWGNIIYLTPPVPLF